MKRLLACLVGIMMSALPVPAGEIGYIEDFALAKNREEALKKLIPGTEDYYYYHCLHYLHTEQFEKVEPLTKPWHERFGQTQRLWEIQTRHALQTYEKNPERALAYLRGRMGLQFNHQKAILGGAPNLPTALDQQRIARATLLADTLRRWSNLDNFEDSALDWLAAEPLNWERRRNLLQRLQRPDVPKLPQLILEDFRSPHAQEFGAWGIHRQLTMAQLQELLTLKPDLLNQANFVQAWLTKLRPNDDENWRRDPAKTLAYLDRLLEFARKLAPVHNSLKAHVLYHRLLLDRSQGKHDAALFEEYLKLPRRQGYMSKVMLESVDLNRYPADLNADYSGFTLLPIIGSDEPLVRSYLEHYFLTADSIKAYEPYINDIYLRHLFAETKIVNGLGDSETWASQLPPELFRALKERIDIDFAHTNKTAFGADEPVKLDMFVKNVPTLLVKVFEINTQNYYRTYLREVDTDINLDGLVANSELTFTYAEPPLRRHGRRLEFPQLTKPGVYVVDFIGGGKSSRALIRKGRFRPLVAASTAGHKVAVVDDSNQLQKDVILWLGGQEFKADADGSILVPFSTSPGRQPIVLTRGDFSCLDYLQHQPENYHLAAGIYVDREALLTQRMATVLIRPGLYLNGVPVSIKLLEDIRLRIVATDHDGIATSSEIANFKLFEDRETTHELRVPPRLASLNIQLTAKVKSLSLNKKVDLAAGESFALNAIARTEKIEDLFLAKFGSEYVLELLGRTGEAKPDRAVHLSIKHRDFREPVVVTLKSDLLGRIRLGALADITTVSATGPEGTAHSWVLSKDRHTYRQVIHARAGDGVNLPYLGSAEAPSRAELALFEMRGGTILADRFDLMAIRSGRLEIRGLSPGDYDLWLKASGERVRIRVIDGPAVSGHALGQLRHMQLAALAPIHITSVSADADVVTIRLGDASNFARVHVFATRYQPAYSAYANLSRVRDAELSGVYPAHAEAAYLTGRNIGDEFRYVLDRRYQRKFPGNMLARPELLLNPWVLRSTETGEQAAHGGDAFVPKGEPAPSRMESKPDSRFAAGVAPGGDFANFDFLAEASAVILNRVPDKDGVVKVSRKEIGSHAMIHVVAVDPLNTTYRSIALEEKPAQFVDLRLHAGLDPAAHFTQQKQVSMLPAGQPFTLADAAASRFEMYDSLPKVYALYATLTNDAKLLEFSFILNWPNLKPEEKRTLYSKYACHELSFFLSKKDPEFFRTVIKPYLANKKDKTFLDRWLLEENLAEFADPWKHARLNAVERVLLAQRLQGEPAKTARHLNDLLRLQPPNVERLRVLFETAIKSSSLGDDSLGLDRFKQEQKLKTLDSPTRQPAAAKPAAPPGMPPGGGRAGDMDGAGMGPAGPGAAGGRFGAGKGGAVPETAAAKEALGEGSAEFRARDGRTQLKDAAQKLAEEQRQSKREQDEKFYFNERERLGVSIRQFYRKVDPTQEWAENNYYNLPIAQQLASLVTVSEFWLDYAKHDGKTPFLSRHLADASRNFTEMMLALAVLDLPFAGGKHEVKFDGGKMQLKPAGTMIAFHEEVRPVDGAPPKVQILVSQNFYRHGDRFREEQGERFDKFVTGEFVIHTVYGGHIVVTNPTPSRQKLAVLIQTPVGSIPIANGQPTKTVMLDLEPYRTQTLDYMFYFPRAGKYAHFPVHVAKAESLVASAAPFVFNVVDKPSRLDTESWDYISQNGTPEEVLAYLNRENVHGLDLSKIAFRMRDKAFFAGTLQLLRERHAYNHVLWSYAIHHNAVEPAREFLAHADQIVNECGGPISSPLLTIDPVARHHYEHLEYKPLVNARAHSLGQRRQIVNDRFHEQYHRFLKMIGYRPQLSDDDLLTVTYYLLLQDRIEEAMATFGAVHPEKITTRMQYDYCSAYLDFYGDDPLKARAMAMKYVNHPVDRWRNAFASLANQLNEIEGGGPKIADADDRDQRQGQLAAKEPSVEFTIEAKAINLTWQNLDAVRVNYYLMDVELLFSRNPFVQQSGGQFSSIRPNFTQEVKLPPNQNKLAMKLPENLVRRNVLVEVVAAGKVRSLPYYANAMEVKMMENYGQVRITDAATGKPQAKVYVKTYVRLADGTVKFYKDGYTDHRGRFDYASVSTPEKTPPMRFSILVLSDEHGATIREAVPPQQ